MKKTIAIIIALILCITLVSCGDNGGSNNQNASNVNNETTPTENTTNQSSEPEKEKTTPISFDKANKVEDSIEFTIKNVYASTKVEPPILSGVYRTWEADSGNSFLVVVAEVKNTGSAAVKAEDILNAFLSKEGNDSPKAMTCAYLEEDASNLAYASQRSIDPLATATLYYFTQVPQSDLEGKFDLTVKAKDQTLIGNFTIKQFESAKKPVKIGDMISNDDMEVTIQDIYFKSSLYPPKATGYYHYYEASSGKTFLIVKVSAKNLKGTSLKYDAIAGVSCIYKEKYNYTSNCVLEEDGGQDLNGYPSQYAIDPLDSGVCYYLMEVPQEVENGPVEITFYIAGDYYYYKK